MITYEEYLKQVLMLCLKRNGGNKSQTAKELCMPRSTVQRLIKKFEIEDKKKQKEEIES